MKNTIAFLVGGILTLGLVAGVLLYGNQAVRSSDHQDSPLMVARPGADITDVFVFPAANPRNVVLAMNVHPLIPAGEAATVSFDPAVMYQIKISTTGSYKEDKVIQFRAMGSGAAQKITMYGPARPAMVGTRSVWLAAGRTFQFNTPQRFSDGVQVFAGPRKDPFYFDLAQFFKIIPDRNFKNQPVPPPPTAKCFRTPGTDFLKDFNVLAFVVEVPRMMLAGPHGKLGKIRVYETTSLREGSAGVYTQVERLARPAVKEATEPFKEHDITNRSAPWQDAVLKDNVYKFMTTVAGRSPQLSQAVTGTLIPDEMIADLAANGEAAYLAVETKGKSALPTGIVRAVPNAGLQGLKKSIANRSRAFGGRDLSSPVIDLSLGVLFGSLGPKVGLAPDDQKETQCLTSDNVQPSDRGVTTAFPYMGNPV